MIADPLTWLFGQAVRVRNARYDKGRAPIQRLRLPVISVGNISVGGSGKTPFVQTLGHWLNQQGIAFDILSRGYGRSSRGVLQVDAAGTAALYGDEPLLLARTLKVPVFVGEDRYEAGLAAEAFGARTAEPRAAAHSGRWLPAPAAAPRFRPGAAGGPRSARPACCRLDACGSRSRRWHGPMRWPRRKSWPRCSRSRTSGTYGAVWCCPQPAPTRPLAFCGLAQPRQFWQSLADIGIYPVGTYAFRRPPPL